MSESLSKRSSSLDKIKIKPQELLKLQQNNQNRYNQMMDIDTLINARKMQKIGAHSKIKNIKLQQKQGFKPNSSTPQFNSSSQLFQTQNMTPSYQKSKYLIEQSFQKNTVKNNESTVSKNRQDSLPKLQQKDEYPETSNRINNLHNMAQSQNNTSMYNQSLHTQSFFKNQMHSSNISQLEQTLNNLVEQQNKTLAILQDRANQLASIISDVLTPDTYDLKTPQDFDKLNNAIRDLCYSLQQTSKNELDNGATVRENEKFKIVISNNALQEKKQKLKNDENVKLIEMQKERIKILEEDNLRIKIQINQEKHQSSINQQKVDNLEKRIAFLLENNVNKVLNPNDKLRSCLNELLKENESLKRDLEFKNKDLAREKGKGQNFELINSRLQKQIDKSKKIGQKGINKKNDRSNNNIQNKDDIDLLGNFKIPNSVDFRIQSMRQENQIMIRDILENKNQFSKHIIDQLKDKDEQKDKIQLITNQFVSFKEFSERYNSLVGIYIQIIQNFRDLPTQLSHLNEHLLKLFHCKEVNIWVIDQLSGSLVTYNNDGQKRRRIAINKGIVGEVFDFKQALNVSNAQKKAIHFSLDEGQNVFADSAIVAPIFSSAPNENFAMKGIIQIIDSETELFGFDDECLLIVLSEMFELNLQNYLAQQSMIGEIKALDVYIDSLQILSQAENNYEFAKKVTECVALITGIQQSQFYFVQKENPSDSEGKIIKYDKEGDQTKYDLNHGIIGLTARSLTGNIVSDIKTNTSFNKLVDIQSLLPVFTLPITQKNGQFQEKEVQGVLQVVLKHKIKYLDFKDEILNPDIQLFGMMGDSYKVLLKFGQILCVGLQILQYKQGKRYSLDTKLSVQQNGTEKKSLEKVQQEQQNIKQIRQDSFAKLEEIKQQMQSNQSLKEEDSRQKSQTTQQNNFQKQQNNDVNTNNQSQFSKQNTQNV